MKKIKYLLISLIFILFNKNVYANDIKSINMDIYIDNYGDAHVTEIWEASLNSGTEGYKPYSNLGTSEIKDLQVKMNGINFSTISNWDTDASFDAKKYKAGINYLSDGVELCFGISKYGNNSYTIKYTITDFVLSLNDADMVYWQLIPYELSDKPEKVYIKIYSDFAYENTLDVWGYGYGDRNHEGYAYVYDGYIEMSKEGSLSSDEYMTVLIKFPKNTFNTDNIKNENFSYYEEMAESGAEDYHSGNTIKGIWAILIGLLVMVCNFLPFIIVIIVFVNFANTNYGTKKLKFLKNAKKLKDVPYFRDIPCDKDIFKAYWVACQYKLIKNNTDFLGAILLKWLKDKNIENVSIDEKKKALKLVSANNLTPLEVEIFTMMQEASIDGILENDEFTRWCKNNYQEILNWFNKVIDDVTIRYVSEGKINEEVRKFNTIYHVNEKMQDDAIKMAGLKKFLNEFSNIKDRNSIEVNLWEEYLMYAQIFGIAKKVAKEFKRLYPDIITDQSYDDIIFIHNISYNAVYAASSAKSRAESYSSGGGGFSSSGGGGGSFGGGGGGGFR